MLAHQLEGYGMQFIQKIVQNVSVFIINLNVTFFG